MLSTTTQDITLSKKISPISLFAIHIEMIRSNNKIGSGTGFIYFHEELNSHFLITNYHVLTARDPKKPSWLLKDYPDSPDELRWNSFKKRTMELSSGSISILADDGIEWIEHPMREQGVDIVAVKVDFPSDMLIYSQNMLGLVKDIELEVGAELFVVGYPFGIAAGDVFPLWKRGTIASEPLIKPNNQSRFYIDATTMPGMSGSPVFAVETRQRIDLKGDSAAAFQEYEAGNISALDMINRQDPQALATPYNKKYFRLVGIYSGRLFDGKKDPSIGIVWNYHLIEELFTNPVITEHPFPPLKIDA